MASFIARVELHDASYQDYVNLHVAMANRGYARTIQGSDGHTYSLPTGTYDAANMNSTLQYALDSAKAAANSTGKASAVIVAERSAAMWNGLG